MSAVNLQPYEELELEYECAMPQRMLDDLEFEFVRNLYPWEMVKLPSELRVAYFCTAKWHRCREFAD